MEYIMGKGNYQNLIIHHMRDLGKMVLKMALENEFSLTNIIMKESGKMVKKMEKVNKLHKQENIIQEIGRTISLLGKENSKVEMEANMMDNG